MRLRAEAKISSMGALPLFGRRHDGAEFPVEINLSLLPTATGRLRVITAVRDISERLLAEDRVHEVQRMLDATHDAVLMFDPDTLGLTYVNQGAIDQLGYTREELLTMTAADINPTITEASCRAIVRRFGPGKSSVFTTVHRRKDGTDFPVEVLLERPATTRKAQAGWWGSHATSLSASKPNGVRRTPSDPWRCWRSASASAGMCTTSWGTDSR